jgi:hypothetical protein
LPLLGYEQGQNKNKNCLEEAEQEAGEKTKNASFAPPLCYFFFLIKKKK